MAKTANVGLSIGTIQAISECLIPAVKVALTFLELKLLGY